MTEAFICDFARTPIGRYEGGLSQVRADDLAATAIKHLIGRNVSIAEAIDEVFMGCANQAGEDNRNVARMASLLSGLPAHVPGVTLNRLCASGLDAVAAAARAIRAGEIDLAIAGGVESMTRAPFVMGKAQRAFQRTAEIYDTTIGWRFVNAQMQGLYGVDSMPETGENVATDFNVSRDSQDAFALRSQQRALRAEGAGVFAEQIVPVAVPGTKGAPAQIMNRDEQPRPDTTLAGLAKLKPVVRVGGTVTAGNASSINDGAAALLLASGAAVEKFALKPRARVLGFASAGVLPRVMGVGPIPAVEKLMKRLRMKVSELDVIELNEAFASQALACMRALGLPDDAEHVNCNGGAIALGHPLGMSGARIAGAAVQELLRRSGRFGLATMCVGVGQGAALAFERV
ncbi:MAG: 3-oxoadipyl-CoA thiolase [Pseudomonadota bacterium]|nr:3-oxoadipyl-CoA thiolase [Pseudomonadota bacterium]